MSKKHSRAKLTGRVEIRISPEQLARLDAAIDKTFGNRNKAIREGIDLWIERARRKAARREAAQEMSVEHLGGGGSAGLPAEPDVVFVKPWRP